MEEIEKTQSFLDLPAPTKETKPRQRSINVSDLFLTRLMPPWSRPPSLPAFTWRSWVLNQPVAIDAREFLISSLLSLDWKIVPRNSKYRDELDATIRYYTDLLTNGGKYDELGLDYAGLIEWVVGDLLDIPFGGAAEVGRKNDSPDGRVVWIRPLDGGTLYPTLNRFYPVVQYYQGWDAVAFPQHAIVRTFISPQQSIWREGWGMAPPEKVYFALDLLSRGDKYYANLLLDIPTVGILDLGDMEKSAAEEWITAFKTFVNDVTTSFKIPVLYEHNNEVKFLPFGKVPNDIMFDKITHKYATLLCAAYGISPTDIGLSTTTSSGETLAGSIRSQRQTKITGRARVKAKMKSFFDRILPPSLEFQYVDYDTEDMINLGRARLASATAFQIFQDKGAFSRQEIRSQAITDGLFTVNLPDELPPDAQEMQPQPAFGGKNPTEPEVVGNKKSPSQGGEGEVKSFVFRANHMVMEKVIDAFVYELTPKIFEIIAGSSEDDLYITKSVITESFFIPEHALELQPLMMSLLKGNSLGELEFTDDFEFELKSRLPKNVDVDPYINQIKKSIQDGMSEYLGKSISFTLTDALFSPDSMLIDTNGDVQYEMFSKSVKASILNSLSRYVSAYVTMEVNDLTEYLYPKLISKSEPDARDEPVQLMLPNITVNMPEQTHNFTSPQPVINVSVPAQEPAQVHMDAPQVNVNVEPAHIDAPVVNITTPDVRPNIEVNIPKMDAPNVVVNQDAPVVNLSLPDQPAPIVQVTNEVNPTPVHVDVDVPKESHRIQYIKRDNRGEIELTETDVFYEDDEKGESDE